MNKSLKVLFIFNGIFVFAYYLISPLYAIFAQGIVKDVFLVSLTISTHFASTTLFTFIISRIGDQIKEKEYLLLGGFLTRSIVWFCYIFAKNIQILIILQIILGLGEALGSTAFSAIFAEHLDNNKHIKEYGSWHVITNIVATISSALAGFVVSRFGFTPLFIAMSILAFISFIGVLTKPRELL